MGNIPKKINLKKYAKVFLFLVLLKFAPLIVDNIKLIFKEAEHLVHHVDHYANIIIKKSAHHEEHEHEEDPETEEEESGELLLLSSGRVDKVIYKYKSHLSRIIFTVPI